MRRRARAARGRSMALKAAITELYTGRSRRAARFRYGLIGLDIVTVAFFILTARSLPGGPLWIVEAAIGVLILTDLSARLWISPDRWRMLRQVYTLADLVVVASLIAEPLLGVNLSFLKVLRALRLMHSYRVLHDLRRDTAFFRRHEDAIVAAVDLCVFIFVATSVVYVLVFDQDPGLTAYVDALYFTVATLTTTGYGDITMQGPWARLMAVFMMVMGVALFFRLARALFVPAKLRHRCEGCGLTRHEPDAVHCKHCGETLRITHDGAD